MKMIFSNIVFYSKRNHRNIMVDSCVDKLNVEVTESGSVFKCSIDEATGEIVEENLTFDSDMADKEREAERRLAECDESLQTDIDYEIKETEFDSEDIE
ncbi:MAG TPA: hypothetical protein DCR21_06410 [Succinivibrionaceae bacterium]|nr:hypothetical protein [Succinivibrionaceae bacterium]